MTAKDRLYLATYHVFKWLVTHTPEKIRFPILRAISRFVWFVDKRHRRIARVNLDLAFGDGMGSDEKERIIKKSYEHLVFNLADALAHQDDTPEEVLARVTLVNRHYLDEAMKEGRPVVFIGAHYGNWEMIPRVFGAMFGPATVVGRPLDSKAMDELLARHRNRFGIEVIPKKGAMRHLVAALKKGRSVGLIVDQNTSEKDGILINFFGKKARHTPAAAILARRFDLPVVPVFIQTDDHRHFTLTIHPPLYVEKSDDMEADIAKNVQAQADVTERVIREKPDEWFWQHKRWKNQYEELYR